MQQSQILAHSEMAFSTAVAFDLLIKCMINMQDKTKQLSDEYI